MSIQGSIVALVTPMQENGSIDFEKFKSLIDWHIEEGTNAIIVAGTTGESATISVEEHCDLVKVAVEHTQKRIPIIAGTGGNSTSEAIELTKYAKSVGADASLQVVPYYNKPTQEGLYQHFKAVAQAVDIDIILYNVPGRTVADMSNDTAIRLASIDNIIGIKDATGNVERGIHLINMAKDIQNFRVYSGDDATAPLLMLMGAKGNISVTANVLPKMFSQIANNCINHIDIPQTLELYKSIAKLNSLMFCEANPIPVKYILAKMNKISDFIRLPLTKLSQNLENAIDIQIKKFNLI